MDLEKSTLPHEAGADNLKRNLPHSTNKDVSYGPEAEKDDFGTSLDAKIKGTTDPPKENTKNEPDAGEDIIEMKSHVVSLPEEEDYTNTDKSRTALSQTGVSNISDGNVTTRPGAVAVAGPGMSSDAEQEIFSEDVGVSNQTESSPRNTSIYSGLKFSAFLVTGESFKNIVASTPNNDTDAYGPVIDGVIVEDTSSKYPNQNRRGHYWIVLFVLLMVAGITLVIALPLTLSKSSTKEPIEHVRSPSLQPTAIPTASPTSDRFQLITSALSSLGIRSFAAPSQRRALVWLADEDPAHIEVGDIVNLTHRYALSTIYFALGGDSTWTNQLNFLSADPVCDWNVFVPGFNSFFSVADGRFQFQHQYDWFVIGHKGVFCDEETGMVNGIDLATNNMTGIIPEEIGLLKHLRHISLWRNQIHGSIPSSLYNLNQIETVIFMENQITGVFPTAVGKLRNLTVLSLTDNHLTGSIPESIGELTFLTLLGASFNHLTGTIPSEINKLSKLNFIWLENNMLNGTIPLKDGNFPDLSILNLHKNRLTGTIPETIYSFTNLINIKLQGNFLTGTISKSISNLTNLVELNLSSNMLNGSIPSSIGNNSKLEYLLLDKNGFTGVLPDTLGSLANLREFAVNHNSLSGTIPTTVAQVPSQLARYNGNNFNGSLDSICDQKPNHVITADCYGDNPEVLCSCCGVCCSDDDGCFGPSGCKFTAEFLCT